MKPFLLLLFFIMTATIAGVGQTTADAPALLMSSIPLTLPAEAEAAGIDGTLSIGLTVDKTGAVKDVKILAGPAWPCGAKEPKREIDEVRKAVKENLTAAKFAPAIENGKPKSSELRIKFAVGEAYKDQVRKREHEDAVRNGLAAAGKSGVLNGRALRLVAPAYPELAKAQGIRGSAAVEILIDERGDVARAGIIGGHSLFHDSVRNAACAAKFRPTEFEGKPVKVSGTVVYNFQ